ncbi:UDP-N-acetylmuramoyl-L-alanyl-D-glutamate--2,6-diaminopimelate ligase [Paraliobacillus ryukyuensis]|uniref:UDP-N-acetylmuramoyl-L-alanyl-D-glutamate--2, 6-diaminopimelate ligase n=1 Tax=Paraliobacillus ryukyuensis TaxID=200904 RepID=UPI0009A7639F|nr:UDP-N-acetylmuramoyl-L-alanyl-D-glutamate--2,6-diaminopimelate ligase [Paraliobacillus ryukyuensis]
MKQLEELVKLIPQIAEDNTIPSVEITGITVDSRQVKPGYLFFCIVGYTVDGHDFVEQAIANGASAIVAEKPLPDCAVPVIYARDVVKTLAIVANAFYDFPTQQLSLIGVTGTNGKTTVTNLINEMLQANNHITGTIGTIQMTIANQSYRVANTTPEASFLQHSFDQMVKEKVDTAVMEVSSHALELGRVNGCDFDIAVFTNLSQDHLNYHGTMENYFLAKSRLFQQLGNSYAKEKPKYAVINADDDYSTRLIHQTVQPTLTYGIVEEADVRAENIVLNENGCDFCLQTYKGSIDIHSKLMGKFSIYNMLAAATAALLRDIPLAIIKKVLETTNGVSGRFEPVNRGQSYGVIVDYAHTPDSLQNVLQTIKEFAKGKVYVIVGCGGDRDKTKRPFMAEIACKYADQAIFTSDNPRTENPDAILEDMIVGLNHTNYQLEVDRRKAIEKTIALADESDIILIAGKGHETYQIVGKEMVPFDDREIAANAIMENS